MQWPKEKGLTTKKLKKTKDRATQTPLETRNELRYSGKITTLLVKFNHFLNKIMVDIYYKI
jgi:hypothetical protein